LLSAFGSVSGSRLFLLAFVSFHLNHMACGCGVLWCIVIYCGVLWFIGVYCAKVL
jgi:hypothetical protein